MKIVGVLRRAFDAVDGRIGFTIMSLQCCPPDRHYGPGTGTMRTAVGVLTQCESPWAARTRFVPKSDKGLRMVHTFNAINDVTVKSNYPMRRIELVLQTLVQPWISTFFKCDGLNGCSATLKTPRTHTRFSDSLAGVWATVVNLHESCYDDVFVDRGAIAHSNNFLDLVPLHWPTCILQEKHCTQTLYITLSIYHLLKICISMDLVMSISVLLGVSRVPRMSQTLKCTMHITSTTRRTRDTRPPQR